jgi:hypothetical protein
MLFTDISQSSACFEAENGGCDALHIWEPGKKSRLVTIARTGQTVRSYRLESQGG